MFGSLPKYERECLDEHDDARLQRRALFASSMEPTADHQRVSPKRPLPATLQPCIALPRDILFHGRLPATDKRQSLRERQRSTRKHGRRDVGNGEEFAVTTSGYRSETLLPIEQHMLHNAEGVTHKLRGEKLI